MNFSEYIKLIFEARQPSQNVKAAMEMSDDELADYLEELFPDIKTIISSQPGLYQYLLRSRKDVLEKLKAKRAKGIDYYKNIISKFKTLPELKSEYPSLYATLYSKFGKEVANELLSGLERGTRGRKISQSTTKDTEPETIQQTENPYLKLQDLESILSNYSSFDDFRMKNVKLLSDLSIELGGEQFSEFMNDIENKFIKLQPLSLDKAKKIISNYEYLGDFRKENPKLLIDIKKTFDKDVVRDLLSGLKRGVAERKNEKFRVTNAREIISKYTDLDIFITQRSDVAQNIRKYFGTHGFYELTKGLIRKKQVSVPKEELPTGKIREIATKYKDWDSLLANEKDFVKLGLKIYGTLGFKKLVNNILGIQEPVKTTKSILTKGSIGKIPTSKIKDFLSKFPTKESLKSKRPEVYDTLEELGIINSYYGR
jgi:prophage antirepressor-like protein